MTAGSRFPIGPGSKLTTAAGSDVVRAFRVVVAASATRCPPGVLIRLPRGSTSSSIPAGNAPARVSVTWPDGTEQKFDDLRADRYYRLAQGQEKPEVAPGTQK